MVQASVQTRRGQRWPVSILTATQPSMLRMPKHFWKFFCFIVPFRLSVQYDITMRWWHHRWTGNRVWELREAGEFYLSLQMLLTKGMVCQLDEVIYAPGYLPPDLLLDQKEPQNHQVRTSRRFSSPSLTLFSEIYIFNPAQVIYWLTSWTP